MNRYKIIVPYQSDIIHMAKDEYAAFDLCYDEIARSQYRPKIFVVLDLTSNTPYYLEITDQIAGCPNKNTDGVITKDELLQEVRDVSEFKDIREKSGMLAPLPESKPANYVMLEKRIDMLETELIKMKMKLDYTTQVSSRFGLSNMNNIMTNQVSQANQPNQSNQSNQPNPSDDCTII